MKNRTATKNKKITITKRNDYTVLLTHQTGSYQTLIEISKDFNSADFLNGKLNKDFNYRLLRNENDALARWQSKEQAENYTSEKAIKKSIATINRQLRDLKIELNEARLNPLYLKMEKIADQKIKYYKTDFNFYDCLILHRQNPVRFIWMLRETGSWLITDNNKWQNELISRVFKLNSGVFKHDYYYMTEGNIKKVTQQEANRINQTWKE